MSVHNAGAIIREARLKAGLTQEQLSEGVCSTLSLSRIENGTAGVSPSTFQALMAHANAACEAYPVFANRTDFDCFYALKQVRFYLDSWQLQIAYDKLEEIEQMHWAGNKFYYQEWLLLHGKLRFRSGRGNHQQVFDMASDALHISRPDFDGKDFHNLLLSFNELELCILFAQEALYLGKCDMCSTICAQISAYLSNSQLTFLDKDRLLAENAIVHTKYLIATADYKNALKTADYHRHKMAQELNDAPLLELTFLTALGYYYTNDKENALTYFKMAYISAHSIGSCYATICRSYTEAHLDLVLPESLSQFEEIPLPVFPHKKAIDTSSMGDGTYDFFSPDVLTLGGLIRELRTEQKLSQTVLCQGLCSKSKLSKIENGTLQPEIILAQTLLQRLGISDLVFTFYGSEREASMQELVTQLAKTKSSDAKTTLQLVSNLESLCTAKDSLYLQYILFKKSTRETEPAKRISGLQQALAVTLPDFDFKYIHTNRLSKTELSILNNLCSTYVCQNPSVGIQYFYKLVEYYDCVSLDILEKSRFFPITFAMLTRCLYSEKRFSEIKELSKCFSQPEIKNSLYFTGHIFFHYCQALGELDKLPSAEKYGNYSHQLILTSENVKNANLLKAYLYDDFNIILL